MLTEDQIRIVKATNDHRRKRNLTVFVAHHMLKDARGRMRTFGRRSAADRAAHAFIAEHNQTRLPEPRWTRQGRVLSLDGVEALEVGRFASTHNTFKLSPVQCDAIADYVCSMLNTVDLDALTSEWVRRP